MANFDTLKAIIAETLDFAEYSTFDLITEYNELGEALKIEGFTTLTQWKAGKGALCDKIKPLAVRYLAELEAIREAAAAKKEALLAVNVDAEADRLAEVSKSGGTKELTIGSVVSQLVMNPLLSYDDIVAHIMAQFPEAQTSRRSVASIAARLRKVGVEVPLRRKKGELE